MKRLFGFAALSCLGLVSLGSASARPEGPAEGPLDVGALEHYASGANWVYGYACDANDLCTVPSYSMCRSTAEARGTVVVTTCDERPMPALGEGDVPLGESADR